MDKDSTRVLSATLRVPRSTAFSDFDTRQTNVFHVWNTINSKMFGNSHIKFETITVTSALSNQDKKVETLWLASKFTKCELQSAQSDVTSGQILCEGH